MTTDSKALPGSQLPDAWQAQAEAKDRTARETIDYLARQALAQDWTVFRQGPAYFRATRHVGEVAEQVSVAVIDGRLQASRVEIKDVTNVSDDVVAWLEGNR